MKKFKFRKMAGTLLLAVGLVAAIPSMASAHCDTMDGPVITDAQTALETNNSNYILKWVFEEDEEEISEIFDLAVKVRELGPEAQELADRYFYENLVRIHRAGEGAPYTGVKPHGFPMEEAVIAADQSIVAEDLSAFEGVITEDRMHGLEERFEQVLATKDFDKDDVEAGRKFVEAYVEFTHYAEGEEHGHGEEGHHEDGHHEEGHQEEGHHDDASTDEHAEELEHAAEEASMEEASMDVEENQQMAAEKLPIIPWSLAGVLFGTTLLFATGYYRKSSK